MVSEQAWRKPCVLFAAALAVMISAAGCSSGPEPAPGAPPVSCILLSGPDLWQYGTNDVVNPFVPRKGFIRGADEEFVALRIRLSLPESAQVSIDGSVQDPAGKEVAPLQTLAQMTEYWSGAEDVAYRDQNARSNTLTRYYPASFYFTAKKGSSEYVVVFRGKNPLPRPASVMLSVAVGDAQPQQFNFPLPDMK